MASERENNVGEVAQTESARSRRGSTVRDRNGTNGACTACTKHFEPLLSELSQIRVHGPAMQRVRANQIKHKPQVRALGQKHKARRQWLWTHAFDSHGSWSGHRECISKLTGTNQRTLTNLRRLYCERRAQQRFYPACVVLNCEELLKELVYDGDHEPENWASLQTRRNWLKRRIFETGDNRTPVPLPPDSSTPPLHLNVFKKRTQKMAQLERFKSFIMANAVPTGRRQRGKTHYLLPSIRRIRPSKLNDSNNDALRARHTEMTYESLTHRFNETLSALEPPLATVSHDTICRWLKEYFPRYGVSPVQSDYCDTCSEIKQQIDSARRAKQHLLDSGNAAVADISAKEILINSYEANLRQHRDLATKEQEEYKHRTACTSEFFRSNILGNECDQNFQGAADYCLENETSAEVVLACDFQMGKLVPHWGQTAQPGKTYYYQKIMHHVFGIVDSSNSRKYVYVVDETVGGDKDSDHVCSFLFDYIERMVQQQARFLRLYMDAAPYFKTKFIVWWAAEMVTRGRFRRVVMSYMVPGHTKFEPDTIFAQIANRFYKTDVFNTNELLQVIGACDAVPHEIASRCLRRWKEALAEKYVDIPRVSEWNVMVVECVREKRGADLICTGVTLKVKRSVTQDDYEKAFRGGSITMNLLKRGVEASKDAAPSAELSAAIDASMNKQITGDKLRNITEMYDSYVPRDRWPRQLVEALHARRGGTDTVGIERPHIPANSQHDAQAIRVGHLIDTQEGAARSHSYLRRVDGASRMPDEQLAEILRKAPDSGVRTMPRRKRARKIVEGQ